MHWHVALPLGTLLRPTMRPGAVGALASVLIAGTGCAILARDPQLITRVAGRLAIRHAGGRLLTADGMVWQTGFSDCGPAALANALQVAGYRVPDVRELAVLAMTTERGTSIRQLQAAATQLGVPTRLLIGEAARPPRQGAAVPWPLPLVAWVDSAHFVVVTGASSGEVRVVDPQLGRYVLPSAVMWRRWSGAALVVPGPRTSARAAGSGAAAGRA